MLQADSQSGGVAPTVSTVGFPDSTVHESRDLVRATIRNAGLAIPVALITVSLAPVDEGRLIPFGRLPRAAVATG